MIAERLEKATPENWMFPPEEGWTADQVEDLELPFDWELVDGVVVVRGRTVPWHNYVRRRIERHLEDALREPYDVLSEQCVLIDKYNPPVPDIVVYDKRGIDLFEAKYIPVEKAVLIVEVVSPGSRQDDRVRKPAMYAAAGVPYYWRVERGEDNLPEVHEYWLHRERGEYIPCPERPCHVGKLETDRPFPVAIDLTALLKL
ncbi:Uma2 family endonuclease [Streptomyces sp. UNOC14_S4]|uniref:Uma2 family endonuclease n=1 Tax=Streptomyces sp. UNOC14_S4 TaxID=2872340 RepID=UPI001E6154F4|nr:Uma2 family endonuclease [Streptomyces sp. UNOC14_S4]MCC3772767.1 Uma2 family endonuclease [Streptomyces sp. UNOC14_S4]